MATSFGMCSALFASWAMAAKELYLSSYLTTSWAYIEDQIQKGKEG